MPWHHYLSHAYTQSWQIKVYLVYQCSESHCLNISGIWYDVYKVASIQVINSVSQLPNNIVLKFWWLSFQIFLEKKFDLICFKLFFTLIFFWLALMITIYVLSFGISLWSCFTFLVSLKNLARQLLLLDLTCFCVFLDGSGFFKEPPGIASLLRFWSISRGCILWE